MGYKAFVTVSPELISRLRPCPPLHMKAGDVLKLATFAVTDESSMIPSKLKIRDRERPVPGEVYTLIMRQEKPHEFVDAKTGIRCRSRENVSVRLFPHDAGPAEPKGELRFFTCPLTSEPIIFPAPIHLEKVVGVKENGIWWIGDPGVDYSVSWTEPRDRVLFSGFVLVQLGALPERQVLGAVKIDISNRVSVYDRRKDRLSSFARAEHIRRTIGEGRQERTFEFINLRDVATGEVVERGGPERVLTPDGLVAVEEVEV